LHFSPSCVIITGKLVCAVRHTSQCTLCHVAAGSFSNRIQRGNSMKSKLLKSSIRLLVGSSVACLVAAFNTSVTASIAPKANVVQLNLISATPVQALDVGTYADMQGKRIKL
jgi:hypothetical protein